jgi:quercetin dioxygenase-like cupin family protein
MRAKTLLAASIGVLAAATIALAADPPAQITRAVVEKHDLRAQGQEGVMALVTIQPGGKEGRHTHPAEAFGYVVEGTLTLDVEGQPTATKNAGDSFFIGAGKIHEGQNKGTGVVKIVAVFVTDKGKPLTTQAR